MFKKSLLCILLISMSIIGLKAQTGYVLEDEETVDDLITRVFGSNPPGLVLSYFQPCMEFYNPNNSSGALTIPCSTGWKPFIYQYFEYDGCTYLSNYNQEIEVGDKLKFSVTGYYLECGENFYFEILDIIPYLPGNVNHSCINEINNLDFMVNLISAAQYGVFKEFFKMKDKNKNYILNLPSDGCKYQLDAKSCWRRQIVGWYNDDNVGWKIGTAQQYKEFMNVALEKNTTLQGGIHPQRGTPIFAYRPCEITVCCMRKYDLDWNGRELSSVSLCDEMSNNPTCIEGSGELGACSPMCENFGFPISVPIVNGLSSSISPNPNDGNMTLTLNGEILGSMKIIIYDISGNIITTKNFNKNTSQYNLPINLPNLVNGKYYYKIYQDDVEINSGSFTIQK